MIKFTVMGRKDDMRWTRKTVREKAYGIDDQHYAEKQKARDLRQSSWWKKKCASGLCYYCGNRIPSAELTMDHLIPLARGGSSEKINIVPACKDCNNKKKNLLPSEWDEYLNRIKSDFVSHNE